LEIEISWEIPDIFIIVFGPEPELERETNNCPNG
jgi:hypothetical protein